jgi:hypothetical protein
MRFVTFVLCVTAVVLLVMLPTMPHRDVAMREGFTTLCALCLVLGFAMFLARAAD